MQDESVRVPDLEVIVGASGNDVAVFAFYKREDIHQGYDVVCGIGGSSERPALKQILQDCIKTLDTKDWVAVDELDTDGNEKKDEPPF